MTAFDNIFDPINNFCVYLTHFIALHKLEIAVFIFKRPFCNFQLVYNYCEELCRRGAFCVKRCIMQLKRASAVCRCKTTVHANKVRIYIAGSRLRLGRGCISSLTRYRCARGWKIMQPLCVLDCCTLAHVCMLASM
jgi:hypothetical protein